MPIWCEESLSTRGPSYRLHPGDTIDLHYTYTSEYDQTAIVQPDGYVSLKTGGSVRVAELTLEEASAAIRKVSAERLKDPEIVVLLKDFVKAHVTIGGEVVRPGTYDLRGRVTLIDAIALSGGFKDSSNQSQVLLVRRATPELASVRVVDVKRMMTAGKVLEDIELNPDDLLIVPKNRLGKIEPYVRVASLGLTGLYGVAVFK